MPPVAQVPGPDRGPCRPDDRDRHADPGFGQRARRHGANRKDRSTWLPTTSRFRRRGGARVPILPTPDAAFPSGREATLWDYGRSLLLTRARESPPGAAACRNPANRRARDLSKTAVRGASPITAVRTPCSCPRVRSAGSCFGGRMRKNWVSPEQRQARHAAVVAPLLFRRSGFPEAPRRLPCFALKPGASYRAPAWAIPKVRRRARQAARDDRIVAEAIASSVAKRSRMRSREPSAPHHQPGRFRKREGVTGRETVEECYFSGP